MIDVAAAQAGFDVIDGDLAVVGRQGPGHRGGGIALDHDSVRLLGVHHPPQFGQQRGGQPVKRLVGLHQVQIVVGNDPGDCQHLIEHLAVLRRNADDRHEARIVLQCRDHRKQLDRFGTGPEHDEDLGRGSHAVPPNIAGLTMK